MRPVRFRRAYGVVCNAAAEFDSALERAVVLNRRYAILHVSVDGLIQLRNARFGLLGKPARANFQGDRCPYCFLTNGLARFEERWSGYRTVSERYAAGIERRPPRVVSVTLSHSPSPTFQIRSLDPGPFRTVVAACERHS